MDSKTRSKLRSLATNVRPNVIIGKEMLTENVINQINAELESHELVKISVLENDVDYKKLLSEIALKTNSEPICSIGKKLVVYKVSTKKGVKHILEV